MTRGRFSPAAGPRLSDDRSLRKSIGYVQRQDMRTGIEEGHDVRSHLGAKGFADLPKAIADLVELEAPISRERPYEI
jgi:hypothetical protein